MIVLRDYEQLYILLRRKISSLNIHDSGKLCFADSPVSGVKVTDIPCELLFDLDHKFMSLV